MTKWKHSDFAGGLIHRSLSPMNGGEVVDYPVNGRECWKCSRENPDLAHAVYEYAAAVLSEPLRRAFWGHLDEHGCADPGHPNFMGGFGHCPEAMRRFALLPDAERVLYA